MPAIITEPSVEILTPRRRLSRPVGELSITPEVIEKKREEYRKSVSVNSSIEDLPHKNDSLILKNFIELSSVDAIKPFTAIDRSK